MNGRKKRTSVASAVGALALSLLLAAPTVAADATSVTVTGGTLSITDPTVTNFAGRNITGVAQTTTADLDAFTVSDLRGTGAGWNVTAQATQFDGGVNDLGTGSLTMSAPTVASPETESADPTIVGGPYTIDGDAVEIASAAANAGMGVYNFGATTFTLSLPADVYAGTYTSTVTISVQSAP